MSSSETMSPSGRIFKIQRFSIHDGPGIRTTVFLKGCPLRCIWCHNPEGGSPAPQLSFAPEKCIGCGFCMRRCQRNAHVLVDERHTLDRSRCEACGSCTEECYAEALELVGRDASVAEVIDQVRRDEPFYTTSGGGMTLSGGEPLAQLEFSQALLAAAREHGLHTCVETSGFAPLADLEQIKPLVDLFLFDVKETDPEKHVEYTGVANDGILDNLKSLHASGASVRLRLPIVPGCNDRDEHFRAVADLCRGMPDLESVEIMPYHRLGAGKLERLGMGDAKRVKCEAPDKTTIDKWTEQLRQLGARVRNQ